MPGLYFEEFQVGQEFHHAFSRTVTEMDNTMFSLLTMNPQPLHIDAHFSENTEFGQRLFNSMYTLGIMIGMTVYDTTLGTTIGNLGMTEVRFPKPVFHGDTLKAHTKVIAKRESKSRPNQGIVEFEHTATNQRGEVVAICRRSGLMHCKPKARQPLRSFLFVPCDSTRKFESACKTAADCLILDLEDSVAPDQKAGARGTVRDMLKARNDRQKIYIRVNALDTGLTLADLAAVVPGKPDGIILPKCEGGADIDKLSLYLDAFEAAHGIENGFIRILPVATETAMAVLKLDTYAGASRRLWGLTWGGEDLSAALGATRNRTDGKFHSPYLLARDLCLIGAVAAGVVPIDTIYADIDDLEGLKQEAIAARRDGFLGKMAIHPKHIDVINGAFTPSDEEVAHAKKIIAAFEQNPTAGVVKVDGKMVDKPHLRAAQKVLGLA